MDDDWCWMMTDDDWWWLMTKKAFLWNSGFPWFNCPSGTQIEVLRLLRGNIDFSINTSRLTIFSHYWWCLMLNDRNWWWLMMIDDDWWRKNVYFLRIVGGGLGAFHHLHIVGDGVDGVGDIPYTIKRPGTGQTANKQNKTNQLWPRNRYWFFEGASWFRLSITWVSLVTSC